MTLRQWSEDTLIKNGLSKLEAMTILDVVMEEAGTSSNEWLSKVDGQPTELLAIAWLTVKRTASKWLNENRPSQQRIRDLKP